MWKRPPRSHLLWWFPQTERSSLTSCSRSPDLPSPQICGWELVHQKGDGKVHPPPQKDLDPSWAGCLSAMLVKCLHDRPCPPTQNINNITTFWIFSKPFKNVLNCQVVWVMWVQLSIFKRIIEVLPRSNLLLSQLFVQCLKGNRRFGREEFWGGGGHAWARKVTMLRSFSLPEISAFMGSFSSSTVSKIFL